MHTRLPSKHEPITVPLQFSQGGFTLVGLLVALAVSGIVIGGMYATYNFNQALYSNQEQVAELDQNLRAAIYFLSREIRMAGFDPTRASEADILTARSGLFNFTQDLNENAQLTDANENVTFGFAAANDNDRDGVADPIVGSAASLGRDTGGGFQPMIENIHAIGFAYAFDNNGDRQFDLDANGNIIWATDANADGLLDTSLDTNMDGVIDASDTPGGVALATGIPIRNIRAVTVWVLARSEDPLYWHNDTATHVVGLNHIACDASPGSCDPRFKRRLLSANIICRNKIQE